MVRTARPEDVGVIEEVVTSAFGRPNEARLVELIRASDNFEPDLSVVGEEGGVVVGHVLLSYVDLVGATRRQVLELAPVSVRPQCQGRGIGSTLIREVLARADARAEPLILVLGDPGYYSRFGFEGASGCGIEPPEGVPAVAFQVRRGSGFDSTLGGRVEWPAYFEVTDTA